MQALTAAKQQVQQQMASAASAPTQAQLSHSINVRAVSVSLSYQSPFARVESAQSSALLLLEFMEALEKNLYSAFEGCLGDSEDTKSPETNHQPPPSNASQHERVRGQVSPFQYRNIPPMSILWFHRNRKVLDEWLLRLRPALLNLSKIVGAPQFVVKHGFVHAKYLGKQLHMLCMSCKQASVAPSSGVEAIKTRGSDKDGATPSPDSAKQKSLQRLKGLKRDFEVQISCLSLYIVAPGASACANNQNMTFLCAGCAVESLRSPVRAQGRRLFGRGAELEHAGPRRSS